MKLNEFEQYCYDTAVMFTAVRGFGGKRTKQEFSNINEACAYADTFGDKRTMIYAVSDTNGCAAHLFNR